MKLALVTGANKGIGFETVKQLAQKDFFVYLGCRDTEKGLSAIKKLKAEGLNNVAFIQLDVTNQSSVEEARNTIAEKTGKLDVLVNNAGISGDFEQSALKTNTDVFYTVYDTNVFGIVRVTQAFLELLRKAPEPRIVNVSTAMASLNLAADIYGNSYPKRFVVYQSSKAALNMYTLHLAFELRDTPFKVNAVCPGYTQTDFTRHQGTSTPEQAGQRIVKYALIGQDGPTGRFFSEEYFPAPANCPW
ncbi:NAD(P)-dependent dehydrogenase, short-chain alcohol dehydrogenase family [Filimonas lacunae]|uniref:NAD(P)-dependent dehydrogenase, short-chain alcohol dehydrogenase family n=1 Tax=Filimonas lacunae TaxID=477680 RepID=A0A173MFR3_9BACT|nr:SDR family oxidoreductase [Filimonas lacunae]BAV06425.1 short chain dehydrogenase [Filimonas lacunae]SIT26907.1 NAD(P)-dependent dehydrogenase, short-chain alcohol dehydrogenase family [Filimonas lacunae]